MGWSINMSQSIGAGSPIAQAVAVALALAGAAPSVTVSNSGGGGGPPGGSFQFFVSNTGSDANNGLTPATAWAITSFVDTNSNNSKMAGKNVGLVGGTFNIAGTSGVAGATFVSSGIAPTDGDHVALNIPLGTAASPTYVGACDTSGNYSARAAIINVVSGQTGAGANEWDNGIIGCNTQQPSGGFNVVLDGIVLNLNNMDCPAPDGDEGAHGFMLHTTGGSFTVASNIIGNITIQNCEISGIQATDNGGNDGLIWIRGVDGIDIINCYLHDTNKSDDPSHCHAVEFYNCQNVSVTNCTFYNCTGGCVEPKEGCANITVSNCYAYLCGTSTVGNTAVFQAFDGAEGNPNSPNIGYTINNNICDTCGRVTFGESNNANHSMNVNWFNQLIFDPRTSVGGTVVLDTLSGSGAIMAHCGNVYIFPNAASAAGFAAFTAGDVTPNLGDVVYGPHISNYSNVFTNATASITGQDPKFTGGTPNLVSGGGPQQFQYAAGSPCLNASKVNGTGAVCNSGPWDGIQTQIGCSFKQNGPWPN